MDLLLTGLGPAPRHRLDPAALPGRALVARLCRVRPRLPAGGRLRRPWSPRALLVLAPLLTLFAAGAGGDLSSAGADAAGGLPTS